MYAKLINANEEPRLFFLVCRTRVRSQSQIYAASPKTKYEKIFLRHSKKFLLKKVMDSASKPLGSLILITGNEQE